MGALTLWKQAPVVSYKSSICSKGTVFLGLCTLLTLVPPFLIAYRSNGFWLKVDTYREQPEVHFKHNVIAILDTSHSGNYVVWSTYPSLNEMVTKNFRAPTVSSFEDDVNKDGKNDVLHLELEFPLLENEAVNSIKLLVGFDFKLYTMTRLQMDSLIYVSSSSGVPSSQLTVIGDLKFHQREPLMHKGYNTRYKQDVIQADTSVPEDFDLAHILQKYAERNLTTRLDNQYSIWTPSGVSASAFLLRVHLQYPTQTIEYTPGVWQVLKMAWIQYLSILVVFAVIFHQIKEYVFTNQIVPTWVAISSTTGK